jgi:hypothetical protein
MATKKAKKPSKQLKASKKLAATRPLNGYPPSPCGKL